MSDIVERLRYQAEGQAGTIAEEAAAEIERLRQHVSNLETYREGILGELSRRQEGIERLEAVIIGFTGRFVTREMVRDALERKPTDPV